MAPQGEIKISKGINTEDETGLVMSGAYSYGTDEIREIFARGNLLIEWGEEGNYQLTISNYAWHMFGYETGEEPSVQDLEAVGSVISESEVVEAPVKCRSVP